MRLISEVIYNNHNLFPYTPLACQSRTGVKRDRTCIYSYRCLCIEEITANLKALISSLLNSGYYPCPLQVYVYQDTGVYIDKITEMNITYIYVLASCF